MRLARRLGEYPPEIAEDEIRVLFCFHQLNNQKIPHYFLEKRASSSATYLAGNHAVEKKRRRRRRRRRKKEVWLGIKLTSGCGNTLKGLKKCGYTSFPQNHFESSSMEKMTAVLPMYLSLCTARALKNANAVATSSNTRLGTPMMRGFS